MTIDQNGYRTTYPLYHSDEKDSLKIYKFLATNNILLDPNLDKLMKDPDAKRKIWNEIS